MTIHRWLRDTKLEFPRPIYIGRHRYWKLAELIQWERAKGGRVA
jgi:predicted DNA-binding transcriptional regulator AlpA